MASERARAALHLRRKGETYRHIAERLGVSAPRARTLTHAALREEARIFGRGQPTQEAFAEIKNVPKAMNDGVTAAAKLSRETLARVDAFATSRNLNRSQALRALIEIGLCNLASAP